MKQTIWTPINPDGSVNEAELRRPAETAEPTTWEVKLYRRGVGEIDGNVAALFGAMSTFHAARFVATVDELDRFVEWQRWAEVQVKGLSGHVGQLLLHWAQRVSEHDVFRTDVDSIVYRAWPLPNVTISTVPLRTQAEADRVLPALLGAKAARREAVFAPREMIDGRAWIKRHAVQETGDCASWCEACGSRRRARLMPDAAFDAVRVRGGETPMHPVWVRKLQEQAKMAGIDFSLRWGDHVPRAAPTHVRHYQIEGAWYAAAEDAPGGQSQLDGVEYPEVVRG
jgi:hypothetical protein